LRDIFYLNEILERDQILGRRIIYDVRNIHIRIKIIARCNKYNYKEL